MMLDDDDDDDDDGDDDDDDDNDNDEHDDDDDGYSTPTHSLPSPPGLPDMIEIVRLNIVTLHFPRCVIVTC